MIAFSPGIVQGCFEVLKIASRNALSFPQIQASFAYLGGIPIAKVVSTAQGIGWLRASEDGTAFLTPSGLRLLALVGYQPMLRQALIDYVDVERPPWLQNAPFGRSRVIRFVGSELAQVFVEAGLTYGIEDEVVAFWDFLAAIARGQRNSRLLDVGRQGERLSIAYEHIRTGLEPRWVAIENNADGYDVLSVIQQGDMRPLSIEVKASTMGFAGSLHLTRNEWERSQEAENHAFHLWAMNPNQNVLAVLCPHELKGHIPIDCGSGCWESVEIPFSVFRTHFSRIQQN
jgi:hypothetical protein